MSYWSDQNQGTSGAVLGAADNGVGDLTGLLEGVGHALKPHRAVMNRNRADRHVADGIDGRVRGAGHLIHDDAARARRVAGQTRRAGQAVVRQGSDADEDDVGPDEAAVRQPNAAVLEARDLDLQADVDAFGAVAVGEEGRQRFGRDAFQHPVQPFQQDDLGP